MILGSKPIAEMTEDEMCAAIEELRASREALRADAIAAKKQRDAAGIVKEPRAPRTSKVISQADKDMLALLKGEGEDE